MKKLNYFSVILFLLFSSSALTQEIPNASFENWTNNKPDDWSPSGTSLYTNVIQSSVAHTGNFSLRAEIIQFQVLVVPAQIQSGNPSQQFRIPINQTSGVMTGYYQYYPAAPNMKTGPFFLVTLYDSQHIAVGQGELDLISETISTWQSFEVAIEPIDGGGGTAAYAYILIQYSNIDPEYQFVPGTYYLLDDLSLSGGATSISKEDDNILRDFSLEQNYPNPFNPVTNIKFNIPENSFVNLKIFNVQGEEIATLVNEELSAGIYNVDWNASEMPSGVYIYKLTAANINLSRKMILLK